MSRILIVGCGYVGQALAKYYIDLKHEVFALQRHAVDIAGITNLIGDIAQIQLTDLPVFDTIFYLVAAGNSSDDAYQHAYVHGIQNLLKQLPKQSHTSIIYVSSTAVYGQQQGEWVNEESATLPNDFSGKRLLEAESIVRNSGFSHTLVRFGGIYGPERTRLIEQVRNHQATLTPTPCYTNRIHLADCVGILAFLAKHPNLPTTVLGVDCEPVLYNDLLLWLAKQLNAPIPPIGETPARLQKSNKRCSNHLLQSLGYVFQYANYQVGFSELIKEYSV